MVTWCTPTVKMCFAVIVQSQSGVSAPDIQGAALPDEMMPPTEKLTLDDFQDPQVT